MAGAQLSIGQVRKVSVQGSIVDSTSGERIPYATVMVEGTTIGTMADVNGYFVLRNVNAENLVLRITAVGYEPKFVRINNVSGTGLTVQFELSESPKALPGVTVTGERTQGPAGLVSNKVITAGELRRNVGVFGNDVVQTITRLPGVVTTSGISSQYFVRGGGADQNLVMIDGMHIYNLSHAFGLFSFIDPLIVKVANFSAGGFQAQYGGRLSSVFDIQTLDGDNRNFKAAGTIDMLSSDISVSGPLSKGTSSFLLFYRRPLFQNALNKFYSLGLPFDFYDGFGKITTNFAGMGHLSAEFLTSSDRITSPDYTQPDFSWSNNSGAVSGNYLLGDQFNMQMGITFSTYKAEQFPKASIVLYRQFSQIATPSLYGTITSYTASRNEFGLGFVFNFPSYAYTFTNTHGDVIELTDAQVEPDVWATYTLRIGPSLSVEAGLRADLQRTVEALTDSSGGYLAEPRLTVSLSVTPQTSIYAAFGSYHQRLIDLNDENMVFSPFELIAPIPQGYKDESSLHYIAGVSVAPSVVTSLKAEVYYKTFSNLLAVNREKVYGYEPDFFAGSGNAYGFDLSARYDVERYYAEVNYSFGRTSRTFPSGIPQSPLLTYAPRYDLRHQVNLSVGWQPLRRFWLRARWKLTSGLPYTPITGFYGIISPDPYDLNGYYSQYLAGQVAFGDLNSARLSGYQSLDLSASYDLVIGDARFKLTGTVINAYDNRNVFYINNVTGDVVYQLPTAFNISLGWGI